MHHNIFMRTAFLSLGSNMGNREANLRSAVPRLSTDNVRVSKVSSLYETVPVGETAEPVPNYLNVVVEIQTDLLPDQLLHHTQSVEIAEGRTATYRWGPRVIDIDILLLDDLVIDSVTLSIPHPRMRERAFTLIPLVEIAPLAAMPDGILVNDLLDASDVAEQIIQLVGEW